MATPASSARLCHAGQLLKFGCHVEPSSWRRVCTACMEAYSKEGLNVPAARCRYLSGPCGSFGGGRNFFSSWSTSAGVFEGVRALRLAGDSRLLLVFLEEATAEQCERELPVLQRVTGEAVRLRLCAGSKSFCVADNFKAGFNVKTCRVHLAPAPADAFGGGTRARKRPVEDSTASEVTLVGLDQLLQDLGHEPIEPATLVAPPAAADLTPGLPPIASLEAVAFGRPFVGTLTSVDGSGGGHSSGGSDTAAASSSSRSPSHDTDAATDSFSCKQLDVTGRLMAHGETLKAGGSSQWTVVSDARLKDVVATFELGLGELTQLRPKVFMYKGDPSRRHYVGLIAQEVPEALARFCRVRARVRLRPADAEDTEIYMLDHSCLQFVSINAVSAVGDALADAARATHCAEARVGRVEARLDAHQRRGRPLADEAHRSRRHALTRLSAVAVELRGSFKTGSAVALMSTVVALASAGILHNGAGPLTLFSAAAVGVNVAAFAVWDVRAPPPRPAPAPRPRAPPPLVRAAALGFPPHEPHARARCQRGVPCGTWARRRV